MNALSIIGKERLKGEIKISRMKNSALPIIFACALVKAPCVLRNIPRVSDVEKAIELLNSMGAIAEFIDSNTLFIDTKTMSCEIKCPQLISQMRASSYLMGVLLSRFGEVNMPFPGGCNFGSRPIDLHIKGFRDLGAICQISDEIISIKTIKKLNSTKITLDKISVGATINMVLATCMLEGTSEIINVAKEPHVDDLISFLCSCGAKIKRVGNSIIVNGVSSLNSTDYTILPDTIEALTYLTFLGITMGELTLTNVVTSQLKCGTRVLDKMGMKIKFNNDQLHAVVDSKLKGQVVITEPYPGFPTDLHPQFASLLCFCSTPGAIIEKVFPTRFQYVNELKKASVTIVNVGNTVYTQPSKTKSCTLDATDLRAGAALVALALGTEGKCIINNVNYIVRGYENLVEKLTSVGGNIKQI